MDNLKMPFFEVFEVNNISVLEMITWNVIFFFYFSYPALIK